MLRFTLAPQYRLLQAAVMFLLFSTINYSHARAFEYSTTADEDPPVLTILDPESGSTDVGLSKFSNTIYISFDESVFNGSGEVRLVNTSTEEVVAVTTLSTWDDGSDSRSFYFGSLLLEPSTDYHLLMDAGIVTDAADNAFEGISDPIEWSFTTQAVEADAPVVIELDPENGSSGVSRVLHEIRFGLEFDEPVKTENTEARLFELSSGDLVATATIWASDWYSRYHNINFPQQLLEAETSYYVEVDAGAFTDVFGNSFAGISGESAWAFTTLSPESVPPAISWFSPVNGAVDVDINLSNVNFQLTFDEAVVGVTGEVRLRESATDITVATLDPGGHVSKWRYLNFSGVILAPQTSYYIEVDAGAFEDVFGNPFEGLTGSDEWVFTTGDADVSPPVVAWLDPENGSTAISVGRLQNSFSLQFDEAVSFVAGEARLVETGSEIVVASTVLNDWNPNNSWQYFYFDFQGLEPSTSYHVEVDAGAYEDIFGNAFEGISGSDGWSFTTQEPDMDPPVLRTLDPTSGSTDVGLSKFSNTIYITFDEAVFNGSGEVRLVNTSTEEVVAVTTLSTWDDGSASRSMYFGNSLLEPATDYHILMDAGIVEDAFGNSFGGISDADGWFFTTQSVEADVPLVQQLSPENAATGVSRVLQEVTFYLEFDEPVKTENAEARLYELSSGNLISTTTLWASDWFSRYQYIYFPSELLDAETSYYVEVDAGAFADVFGNLFEGISDESTWGFTTLSPESVPPTASWLSPSNGAEGIDINLSNVTFQLTFDEPVMGAMGEVRLRESSTDHTVATITPSNDIRTWHYWTFSGVILDPQTSYYIEVDAGAYEDVFGNAFEGIIGSDTWSFTSGDADTTGPVLVWQDPGNGSTDVDLQRLQHSFSLQFDEAVSVAGGEAHIVNTASEEVVVSVQLDNFNPNSSWQSFNFTPQLLEPSTAYHVEIDAGAYEDFFGNPFEGISGPEAWSFTTEEPDMDPPVLTTLDPESGSTNVGLSKLSNTIYMSFDEPVFNGTGEVRLINTSTEEVVAATTLSSWDEGSSWRSMYFRNLLLEPSTDYHLLMDAGIVEDVFGNSFAGLDDANVWFFTTQSVEADPPLVHQLYPQNGETEVSLVLENIQFQLEFDEPVKMENAVARLFDLNSGLVVSSVTLASTEWYSKYQSLYFAPELLEPETTYYVLVDAGAYTDVFGNSFAGISDESTWSFTTRAPESIPPSITWQYPQNGGIGVDLNLSNVTFQLEFDEEVIGAVGEIRLRELDTDAILATVEPGNHASRWQYISFPGTILDPQTGYYIEVDAGAYEDMFGNPFAGLVGSDGWNFTSGDPDLSGPVAIWKDPQDGSSGVSVGRLYSSFSLQFDEPVNVVGGEARLVETGTDQVVATIALNNFNPNSTWQGISFTPQLLEPSTEYHVEVDAGSYEDIFGNAFEGISGSESWSFTTEEATTDPPFIDWVDPTSGSVVGIARLRSSFSVLFDRPVRSAGGQARLIETSTGNVVSAYDVGVSQYFGHWSYFYFPYQLLEPSTDYHIEIDGSTYEDAFGNLFEGITDSESWSFVTVDPETDGPQVESTNPNNGSLDISIAKTFESFQISFDEAVNYISGEGRLVKTSTGDVVSTAMFNNSQDGWENVYFNFRPVMLEESTEYHVEIDEGTFADLFGNPFAGISENDTWSFTTEASETVEPLMVSQWPRDNSTQVSVGRLRSSFSMDFDEPVTHVGGQGRLIKTGTGEVISTTNFAGNNDPRLYSYFNFEYVVLEPSTDYHIEIDAGSFEDVFGNPFGGISDETTWSFTTQEPDSDPPIVQFYYPANGATNVELGRFSFGIQFDEPVNLNEGNARIVKVATGETVKSVALNGFNPGQAYQYFDFSQDLLEPNTEYQVEVDEAAFVDLFGNEFEGLTGAVWTFTTKEAEADPPILRFTEPYNGEDAVELAFTYVFMEFNEQVVHETGEVRIVDTMSGEVVKRGSPERDYLSRYQWVYLGEALLEPGTAYHVEMDAGVFADVFGNGYEGLSDESWSFTTKDVEADPPNITYLNPQNAETGVSIAQDYFAIEFDEAVSVEDGEVRLVETGTATVVASTRPYDNQVPSRYQGIVFDGLLMEPATSYHLEIDAGLFEDVFGNEFEGIADETSWSFETQSTETDPPVSIYYEPANGSTGVKIGRSWFSIHFDEKVSGGGAEIRLVNSNTDEVVKSTTVAGDYTSRYHSIYFEPELLEPSTTYHFEIEAGAFVDVFGNEFEEITDQSTWAFSTEAAEATPPEIEHFSPGSGETGVGVTHKFFSMYFDEVVQAQAGEIRLVDTDAEMVVATTQAEEYYGFSRYQGFYFDLGELDHSTTYHLEIDAGVFADAFGNDFAGISDPLEWTFSTQTTEMDAPEIAYVYPSDGHHQLSLSLDYFYIGFDEPVRGTGGFIHLVETETGTVVTSTQALDDGLSEYFYFEFDINGLLDPATDYHILIDEGAFVDLFSNEFEGIADPTTWNLRTEQAETDGPVAVYYYLDSRSEDVSIGVQYFYIAFDEKVKVAEGEVRLVKTGTGEVIKTTELNDHGEISDFQSFQFDNTLLETNTAYHIEMDAGIVQDVFDNDFDGISGSSSWSFTTENTDVEAPVVEYLWPRNGRTNVSVGQRYFSISFDETVAMGSGDIRLVETGTGTTVKTTQPLDYGNSLHQAFAFSDALLSPNTQYHIELDAGVYVDVFGNDFAGISSETIWSFQTADVELDAPEALPLFPKDNQENIPVDLTFFQLSFDELVVSAVGDIRLIKTSTDELIATASPMSLGNSRYQGFSFGEITLESMAAYHIEIDAGAYEDVFGNDYGGISDENTWNFVTEGVGGAGLLSLVEPADESAPNISSTFPSGGETGVALDAVSFTVIFDEKVAAGSGDINLVKTSTGEVVKTTAPANLGNSKSQTFFFNDTPLESATEYHIQIEGGTYRDLSNNDFVGISDEDIWSFTTEDLIVPNVTALSPADGSNAISTDLSSFGIIFDEQVGAGDGIIRLVKTDTDEIVATTQPTVGGGGSQSHTISFGDIDLEPFTNYHLTVESSAFTDMSENEFDGISEGEWSFTTEDDELPTISELEVPNGTENVAADNLDFEITFGEIVSASGGTIQLVETSTGNVVKSTTSGSQEGETSFFINFSGSILASATQYHIVIAEGAYSDLFGNDFAGINSNTVWSFTTEDYEAPLIASLGLANGSTNVPVGISDLTITFDEEVVLGTGSVHLVEASSGTTISSIVPSEVAGSTISFSFDAGELESETQYYILIDAGTFEDTSGNQFIGINNSSTWSFTTADAIAPVVESFHVLNGSTDVAISSDEFSITFSEAVLPGVGSIYLIETETDDLVRSITPNVTDGNTYSFSFEPGDLRRETQYHILIDLGAFTDDSGNDFEGVSNASIWSFTTEAKLGQEIVFGAFGELTYGASGFSLEASASSGLAISVASSNHTVASVAGSSIQIEGAGTTEITVSQSGDDDYAAAQSVTRQLTVGKAPLQVSVLDETITYGQAAPTFTIAYDGFVNGEDASVLDQIPLIETGAGENPDAGIYEVTLTGGADDNYTYTLNNGQLTVAKALATITFSDMEQVADGESKVPTITTSPEGLAYTITFDGSSEAPAAPGEYNVLVVIAETNYEGEATGLFRISDEADILAVGPDPGMIKIYPNPVGEVLRVQLLKSGSVVEVYTLQGRRLIREELLELEVGIDVRPLAPGVYMLMIKDHDGLPLYQTRLIKN